MDNVQAYGGGAPGVSSIVDVVHRTSYVVQYIVMRDDFQLWRIISIS